MISPILVLGSTGKTGRRVQARLKGAGFAVRPGSRRASPPFDWQDQDTWAAVVSGCEAVYLNFYPDLAVPTAPQTIDAFCRLSKELGVKRLVLLSGRGESQAEVCEDIVARSGLDYTLLRSSWFAQNFNEGALLDGVLAGTVALAAGNCKEPFLDIEDLADIAFAALTERGHSGQLYDLTGPELLTFAEATAVISEVTGRRVAYLPLSLEDFHEALTQTAGSDMAHMLTELCREVFDGRNESLGDGVERALGRKPSTFADFCKGAAASGTWNQA